MYLVQKRTTCERCRGKGHLYNFHCGECWRQYSPEEVIKLDSQKPLPCGHGWECFQDGEPCPECEGDGEIVIMVDLKDALAELMH